MTITDRLTAMAEPEYRAFQCRLMPTVKPDAVLGVRTPKLRSLAKELYGTPEAEIFLRSLPHRYYEENNLHAFLIERVTDFSAAAEMTDAFLPYVNNWATCDSLRPRAFRKRPPELLSLIDRWLCSDRTYTVRFAIGMLMTHYLDGDFDPAYPEKVAATHSDEYYVNMMIAWYFATALAKRWDDALPYLTGRKLSPWVHNKTIQKSIESYRITSEQKNHLKTLKLPAKGE